MCKYTVVLPRVQKENANFFLFYAYIDFAIIHLNYYSVLNFLSNFPNKFTSLKLDSVVLHLSGQMFWGFG